MHRHVALFLAALGWASLVVGAEVDVRLRLLSSEALEVAYTLPPGCASLAFLKDGDAGRATRSGWQALDGGVAGADRLERPAATAAQPVLRFRVPADTRHIGYAAAFPMGQGLYVHLSNYALADTCGPVRYRLAAPGIAVAGRAVRDAAEAANGDAAAMLLNAPLPPGEGVPVYVDPHLSAAVAARIHAVADGTVAYLHRELPDAAYTRPIIAAGWAEQPGGPNIDGDAADVLRITLFNWPRDPGPIEDAKLTLLVSHEFSHRFQLRDAVDVYPDERLLHEGGGEFLRWMASLANGWMTPDQAAADLDQALSDCMLYTEGRSWRSLSPREIAANWLAYRCGLPAYVYVLAARQGKGTAMQRIGGFYRELAAGRRPDSAQAYECGDTPGCRPRWMPPLLGADGTMEARWAALLRETGLARPMPPSQAQKNAMVLRAMVKLMKDDCGGHSGTTETPDGIIFDGMKACRSFRRDAYVTKVEGRPVFGDPATGAAMTAACTVRHALVLGLKDGGSLSVPCAEPYRMRTDFYRADIGRVLAALRRSQ